MRIRTVQAGFKRAIRFFDGVPVQGSHDKPKLPLIGCAGENDVRERLDFKPRCLKGAILLKSRCAIVRSSRDRDKAIVAEPFVLSEQLFKVSDGRLELVCARVQCSAVGRQSRFDRIAQIGQFGNGAAIRPLVELELQ